MSDRDKLADCAVTGEPCQRNCTRENGGCILELVSDLRHRADVLEADLLRWYEAASPYATPEALRDAIRKTKNEIQLYERWHGPVPHGPGPY